MAGTFATSAAIRHVQTIQSTNVAALSAHNWMELQVEPSEFQTDAGSGGVLLVLTFEEVRSGLVLCSARSGREDGNCTILRERVPHLPNSPRGQGRTRSHPSSLTPYSPADLLCLPVRRPRDSPYLRRLVRYYTRRWHSSPCRSLADLRPSTIPIGFSS